MEREDEDLYGLRDSEVDYEQTEYTALKAIVAALANAASQLTATEFKRILTYREIRSDIKKVMPYLYTAGFLSFSGREITKENLIRVMSSIGILPDERIIDLFLKTKVKSHLLYVYAYYFLLAIGKSGSDSEILRVIKAIDAELDTSRIEEIRAFLSIP